MVPQQKVRQCAEKYVLIPISSEKSVTVRPTCTVSNPSHRENPTAASCKYQEETNSTAGSRTGKPKDRSRHGGANLKCDAHGEHNEDGGEGITAVVKQLAQRTSTLRAPGLANENGMVSEQHGSDNPGALLTTQTTGPNESKGNGNNSEHNNASEPDCRPVHPASGREGRPRHTGRMQIPAP